MLTGRPDIGYKIVVRKDWAEMILYSNGEY